MSLITQYLCVKKYFFTTCYGFYQQRPKHFKESSRKVKFLKPAFLQIAIFKCTTELNPLRIKTTSFSQIISQPDTLRFKKLVKIHQTDTHHKGINSGSYLISMLFCQFGKGKSLRNISNGLRFSTGNLNYLGKLKSSSKSKISYQNIIEVGDFLGTTIILYWKVQDSKHSNGTL